jgi:hypothetical protein
MEALGNGDYRDGEKQHKDTGARHPLKKGKKYFAAEKKNSYSLLFILCQPAGT